jgi:uncharacterized protein YeeX (DUF496 family)
MTFLLRILGIRKSSKRRKFEELQEELKYLKHTSGLIISIMECRMAQMEERVDTILRQRAELWKEIRQLQEQCELQMQSHPSS